MNAVPDLDDDAHLNAQVLASLDTLITLLIFCGGMAFGYLLGAP